MNIGETKGREVEELLRKRKPKVSDVMRCIRCVVEAGIALPERKVSVEKEYGKHC